MSMTSLLDPWTHPRAASDGPLIALGTMNFGKRTPEPEALQIIERALERGVTLLDTANVYTDGESERIVGRALKNRRERALVATKVGAGRTGGSPEGLSRARILAAIDESLARLGADYVDIYYLHIPDHATPLAESLDALAELLAAGKIRAWAVSNHASWQILEMLHLAKERGMPRPALSQVLYNVLIRQLDVEYFRFARVHGLHSTIYNPLAGGLLSGKHARAPEPSQGSRFDKNALYQRRYWSDRFFDLVEAHAEVARSEGMTLVELAYAWLADTPGVDSILIGPGTVEHLDAALDACARRVSPEGRRKIDAIHKDFQGTDASYAR